VSKNGTLKVWTDFNCPWARVGAFWLRNVEAAGGLDLDVEWKMFSLENVNLPEASSPPPLRSGSRRNRRNRSSPSSARCSTHDTWIARRSAVPR
jgi:predicted DsbA family dithiol-disulfide isomerase